MPSSTWRRTRQSQRNDVRSCGYQGTDYGGDPFEITDREITTANRIPPGSERSIIRLLRAQRVLAEATACRSE